MDALTSSIQALSNYKSSSELLAHQKDGRQHIVVGLLVTSVLSTLAAELQKGVPDLNTHKATLIPFALGLISGIGKPIAEGYLKKSEQDKKQPLVLMSKGIIELSKVADVFCNNASGLANTASAVTYVALIALGCTTSGTIGLVGLCLTIVKQKGHLPAKIDRALEPIVMASALISTVITPQNLIIRSIQAIFWLNVITTLALQFKPTRKYLPEWITHPSPGTHDIKNQPSTNYKSLVNRNYNFDVNFSSVHAREVSEIFPKDLLGELRDASELFTEIEAKNPSFSESEREGFEKLKKGVIHGQFDDITPPNLSLFQEMARALLQSILSDKDNFENKIKEFAEIGNSCSEGWLRETTFLLNPKSKDPKWAVHHELAILRSNIIKENSTEIQRINKDSAVNLNALGGANDIHLINSMNAGAWSIFRPYEGELFHQVYGHGLVSAFWINQMQNHKKDFVNNRKALTASDQIFIGQQMAAAHPAISLIIPKFVPYLVNLPNAYQNTEMLVDYIHDAIKPEFDNDGSVRRRIQWEAIQGWMNDFDNRHEDSGLSDYDTKWVIQDRTGDPYYLTKDAVRLLLWDLGVLEAA
jgi:hypothetical protein